MKRGNIYVKRYTNSMIGYKFDWIVRNTLTNEHEEGISNCEQT